MAVNGVKLRSQDVYAAGLLRMTLGRAFPAMILRQGVLVACELAFRNGGGR